MADKLNFERFLSLLPTLRDIPGHRLRSSYDPDGDVLYVSFDDEPVIDSELTDEDVIVRYRDGDIVGFTVLNASRREGAA